MFEFLQVACFPFDDHNCPPIQLISSFCQSAYSWLKEDILNVVVVHCKAGMARTGLMICSLLLVLKVRFFKLFDFCGKFSLFLFFQPFSWLDYYYLCLLCAVLPNSWGGHWLLQPEKMCRWESSSSPKSDCQSLLMKLFYLQCHSFYIILTFFFFGFPQRYVKYFERILTYFNGEIQPGRRYTTYLALKILHVDH